MIKLFKNKVDITGVAVLLMAFFVAVGFKAAEVRQETGWYEVEIDGNPNNSEDQKIGATLPNGPQGDCEDGEEIICAVRLQVATGSPFPANMHEADSLPGVTILDDSFRDQ